MGLINKKFKIFQNLVLTVALTLTVFNATDALLAIHLNTDHTHHNKTSSCSLNTHGCDSGGENESEEECPICRTLFICGKYFNITPHCSIHLNNQKALTAVLDVFEPLKSESYLDFTIRPPPNLFFC